MTEKQLILAVIVFLLGLEALEFFVVRREGSDIFDMTFGWRVSFFLAIGGCLVGLLGRPPAEQRWFVLFLLAEAVFLRFNTLVVSSSGLASYGFWGLRRRFIAWDDVRTVGLNLQAGYVLNRYTISITGSDGTRINHTIANRCRDEFLGDLRLHVAKEKFAPELAQSYP